MLVSSAMAVVITRVTPSMLPPTMITAPTSAAARPKPASSTVSERPARVPQQRQRRLQPRRVEALQLLAVFDPRVLDDLARERGDDRHDQHRLRDHHRGRREQQAELAERTGARQQQVDDEPDDDRRQPHRGVQRDDHRAAARKARDRDRRAERQARSRPSTASTSRLTASDKRDDPVRRGSRCATIASASAKLCEIVSIGTAYCAAGLQFYAILT